MKQLFMYCFMALSIANAAAQDINERPYIEVTGTAEDYFMPNEIHVHITISERLEGKEKATLAQQETALSHALANFKLPKMNLKDASSNYVEIKWKKDQNLAKAKYNLILSNAKQVAMVFEILDSLQIQNAYIGSVSHTRIDSLNQVMRIRAIQAAKTKAQYLVSAINEPLGKPLVIREVMGNGYKAMNSNAHLNVRGARSDSEYYYIDGVASKEVPVTFQKLKIQKSIYIKFEI